MDLASLYVVDLSICWRAEAFLARVSAISLPGMLQWEGIHCMATVWVRVREASTEDSSFSSVSLPEFKACRTDRESVRKTMFVEL